MALKFEYDKDKRTATVCGVEGEDLYSEKIVIPKTVEYYKKEYLVTKIAGFRGLERLKSITIPDSVTSIRESAFSSCSSLTEFKGKYASADGRCLIVNGVLTAVACGGVTKFTIPEGVTSIGESAFSVCRSLTSITIPAGVTSIGDLAFADCSSLKTVKICNEEGNVKIEEHAFPKGTCIEYIGKQEPKKKGFFARLFGK